MTQLDQAAESRDPHADLAPEIRDFFRFFWHEWLASPARRGALEVASGLPRSGQIILQRLFADGPMTSKDLANLLMLDRSTISRQLRPLEEQGLLHTAPGNGRRRAQLTLTPAGRQRAQRIDELVMSQYAEAIHRLDDERQAALADLLAELRHAMEATVAEEAPAPARKPTPTDD